MDSNLLARINGYFNKEVHAIQGQRMAKNKENNMAFLGGLSEAINNHISRQGTHVVGLSASNSGSGVAFNYAITKEKLASITSIGGFDHELEVIVLADRISVKYFKNTIVYDEKVSNVSTFQHQRKRWISSQFVYLKKTWLLVQYAIFNSAVLRTIQFPRLLNLGLSTIITLVLYFLGDYLLLSYIVWPLLFLWFMISITLVIPRDYYSKQVVKSALCVQVIFVKMFLLLFKLKGSNKTFIHTPHTLTEPKMEKNESAR